jgi:hypothetical protein
MCDPHLCWPSDGAALPRDAEAQLSVWTNIVHPVLGKGLAIHLCFPVTVRSTAVSELAAQLCRAELSAFTSPPVFGSWISLPKTSLVCFTGFRPNLSYMDSSLLQFGAWSLRRLHALPLLHKEVDRSEVDIVNA